MNQDNKNRKHVHFLINELTIGGGQRYTINIANGLSEQGWKVSIGVLYSGGLFWEQLSTYGKIALVNYERKNKYDFTFLRRLVNYIKNEKVDVIQGMMPRANWFAVLAGKVVGIPSFMGIMASKPESLNLGQRIHFMMDRILGNRWANKIIVNSDAGIKYHILSGYNESKMALVPNPLLHPQFSTNHSDDNKKIFKKNYNIPENKKVIGIVGRVAPIKDHENFIRSMAILGQKRDDVFFLIVGSGQDEYCKKLNNLIQEVQISDRIRWIKNVKNIEDIYCLMDILVSSSNSEGSPFVVMEAMSFGLPIVATDVGDTAILLDKGQCGIVVPLCSPLEITNATNYLLDNYEKALELGSNAKMRILTHYSLGKTVEKLIGIYEDVI